MRFLEILSRSDEYGTVFWDVSSRTHLSFGGSSCFHLQGRKVILFTLPLWWEAADSSKMLCIFLPYYTVTYQETMNIIPYIIWNRFKQIMVYHSSEVERSYKKYNKCNIRFWLIHTIFNNSIPIIDSIEHYIIRKCWLTSNW